jgi:hypothetical protein
MLRELVRVMVGALFAAHDQADLRRPFVEVDDDVGHAVPSRCDDPFDHRRPRPGRFAVLVCLRVYRSRCDARASAIIPGEESLR